MKIGLTLLFLSAAVAQLPAQDDFEYWPAAKLKGYTSSLKAKAAAGKKGAIASEQLGNRGNYTFMVARREQNGEPEVHTDWSDIFIAQDGEATLMYGGKVDGGHESAPGETRGGKIVGGKTQHLAAGDMAIIPAGTPHQTDPVPGNSFTYMVIKVEKKK